MRSSFMGLETSKRGLFTQQSALYTTGHNISNANTLGYSRQRVNMEATAGFPGIGLNSGTMPGFLGTGVQAGSIQRIRDSFVDHQYRQESTKLGYWDTTSKAVAQMEDVLNEPSTSGLQKSLSEFWQSLQDLATNPENNGARSVVIRRGEAVADAFNYMHKSLTEIQTNLGKEIEITTKDVNSILKQIAELNDQIAKVEPNGYMPNDLYDARDLLLDELSLIVPIETEYTKSGGNALAIAEGTVTVRLKTANGVEDLVVGKEFAQLTTGPNPLLDPATGANIPIVGLSKSWTDINGATPPNPPNHNTSLGHAVFQDKGALKSMMNAYGKDGSTGMYPDMLTELDKMAEEFATAFNTTHQSGHGLPPGNATGLDFFDTTVGLKAGTIKVTQTLIDDPSQLAASSVQGEEGNGRNAQKLADIQFQSIGGLGGATVETFFQGLIGELGVNGLEANKMVKNTATLLGAVEHRRASISSVSLDEEMTDMIRFQQAYNASARMITVVDETLDKIINGMGVVGR
ncbi:flagellar hook-associated protein FlgK [Sporosarcina beigongshangi]|uniref:flagellar hook-associated protein FlgK n=1 Tax=Sporosarcina beigongshangi TaxID=2782538 RepID=UPI001939CFBC|nr:flagellar hook-associated protein FlgK [Sporosarcina beigongshangi]